jgi:hypothetical protein
MASNPIVLTDPDKLLATKQAPAAAASAPSPAGTITLTDPDKWMAAEGAGGNPRQRGLNVSPAASDEQIIRSFGYDPTVIAKSPLYQQMKKSGGSIADILTDPNRPAVKWANNSWLGNATLGNTYDFGSKVVGAVEGAGQFAHHLFSSIGLAEPKDDPFIDLMLQVQKHDFVQNVRQGKPGPLAGTAGDLALWYLMPGVAEAGPGAGLGTRIASGALNGAVAGADQPTDVSGSGDYWSRKAGQTGLGAAVGAGTAAVLGVGSKIVNAARGNVGAENADLIAAGKQHNVRLTYGDVTGNPIAQKGEVAMESVPLVGTAGTRAAQQTEAKAAADNVQQGLWDKFLDTEPGAFQDVQAAAQSGDQRARNLIDKLQNAGNDPDKVLQASIGLGDFRTRQTATELYDNVQKLVEKNNLGDVPLTASAKALNSSLSELNAAKLPNRDVQTLLGQVRASVTPKAAPPAGPPPINIQDFQAWQAAQKPPASAGNDYGSIRQLVSDLGDRIRGYYEGSNAIIGEKGVGYLERVRNALQDDLSSFARTSSVPEVQQAGQVADEYYKTARVPYKDGMLAQASVTTEPDQIFQQFIKAGKGDRAQNFYNALDPKGQAAVRYDMMAKAVNDATVPSSGGPIFSPAKFTGSMSKLNDAYGVFFTGPDKWEMDGFKNLMAHVTRAGQFAENPPTGNRVIPALMGAGAVANPAIAAKVAGLTGLLKVAMTTAAGRNFLLAASSLKPGTAAMENLVDRMTARAVTGGRPAPPQPPPAPGSASAPGSDQQQQPYTPGTNLAGAGSF